MSRASAASWLFVPGSRPDRFDKAGRVGAGAVIVDLEDAVSPAEKPAARAEVASWLHAGATAWVRVNAVDTPWHEEDVAVLAACPGLRGLVVPKAEAANELRRIGERLPSGADLVALVETAVGVRDATAVALCPGVRRLAFGSIDFALDIDAEETDEALLFARSTLVLASRAAGLSPPLDGVTVETNDHAVVLRAAGRARALGFGGKLCIHPAQVDAVNSAFAPAPAEVHWARTVLTSVAGAEMAVASIDGKMIDRPVLARARRIMSRAGQACGGSTE